MAALRYPYPAFLDDMPIDGHAVIEASAGTGKTYAIEHLVIALILRGLPIEQILVVTFTEKAAVELKARIRALLQRLVSLRETPPDAKRPWWEIGDDERRALEQALFAFDRATISTIHGFCHGVLRDLAFDAGMRFGLELTDGREAFRRAFRAELREHIATDEKARPLLEEWLEQTKETYSPTEGRLSQADLLEALLYDAHRARYLEGGTATKTGLREIAGSIVAGFDAAFLHDEYELAAIRDEDRKKAQSSLTELKHLIEGAGGSIELLAERLPGFDLTALLSPRGTNPGKRRKKFPHGLSDRTQRFLETLRSLRTVGTLEQRAVACFLEGTVTRLEGEKRGAGLIDYDDMLLWLREAIRTGPGGALVTALRSRFRHALIDEFQDTDDLQWEIFRILFVEGGDGNRLHVVGDPKQAIYAFRGADVFAYLSARDDLIDPRSPGGGKARLVPLTENFRGTPGIIEATNWILDQKASPALFTGSIRYDQPVVCGRPGRRVECDAGPVTPVTLLALPEGEEKISIPEMRRVIGRRIAAILRRMSGEPRHQLRVLDPDQKPRRVTKRDIFILTRTGKEALEVAEYLREQGVPYAFYKQDGLFQTGEALDVLDVLRAVRDPGYQAARLKAWKSPFFSVPLRDLAACTDLPDAHPLNARLLEWKELADARDFAGLFGALLHESGLAARELFLARSERELTNYLHIFEILLEEALRRRLGLPDLVELLERYITETAGPPGMDGNVQRLQSDRDAVQIMTVHKSKGLEADVVFLFGGTWTFQDKGLVAVYHPAGVRKVVVGDAAKKEVKDEIDRERDEEDRRLAYVAITRPRTRLYLPYFPEGSMTEPKGYYKHLNDRLRSLVEESRKDPSLEEFLEIEEVGPHASSTPVVPPPAIGDWRPPPALLEEEPREEGFERLRRARAPFVTESYTSLKAPRRGDPDAFEPDAFKEDLDEPLEAPADDFPAGPEVGVFLHEAIERLDLDALASAESAERWMADDGVKRLFADLMRRARVDPPWMERAQRMVFTALRSPVRLRGGERVEGLGRCPAVREMEILYPIPERAHALLARGDEGGWTVERGYMKGYVDYVFRHRAHTYFADWKSDRLPAYDEAALRQCVEERYRDQAGIYALGIVRLLGIRDRDTYDDRFGGLLYLFLRGMRPDGENNQGVHFQRPEWEEILAIEEHLLRLEYKAGVTP